MQTINDTCCICLKMYANLDSIIRPAQDDDITIKEKLNICVPNKIWYEEFQICKQCTLQLYIAYKFITTCVNGEHEQRRQKLYESSKQQKDSKYLTTPRNTDAEQCNDDIIFVQNTENEESIVKIEEIDIVDSRIDYNEEIDILDNEDSSLVDVVDENKHQKLTFDIDIDIDINNKNAFLTRNDKHFPYLCKICIKKFRSLKGFKLHQKVCVKDPKCDLCGKVFSGKDNLLKHKRAIHTTLFKHTCTECGRKFATEGIRNKHMKRAHKML